jgi:hypothetical protein
VREIRTLRAMWRALETEPYGVTAPVLDPTRFVETAPPSRDALIRLSRPPDCRRVSDIKNVRNSD